jgi:hypothetical protein
MAKSDLFVEGFETDKFLVIIMVETIGDQKVEYRESTLVK